MGSDTSKLLDMFCTAVEMKQRKKALYEDAMKACPDQVGIETFRMLMDAEEEHVKRLQLLYDALRQGKEWANACRLHVFESEEKKDLLRKIADERGKASLACVDDVVAIETGMKLEDASILFFEQCAALTQNELEREFLLSMIAEEREHFILLADLKYYYADPESWFLEKSRARLDGAGAMT